LGGEGIADHVADVVSDEIGLFDAEAIEHAGDIMGLGFLVIASFRVGREPHAAQVGDDDRVVFRELRRQGRPHIPGVGKTVQHDDGWPGATETHMDGGAAGLDVLGAEARREGLNHSLSSSDLTCRTSSAPRHHRR
jgi:hypothetical protein